MIRQGLAFPLAVGGLVLGAALVFIAMTGGPGVPEPASDRSVERPLAPEIDEAPVEHEMPPIPVPAFLGRSGLVWASALSDTTRRQDAIEALVRAGTGAVPLLTALLRQSHHQVRWGALLVLLKLSEGTGEIAIRTLALLAANAPDSEVREKAIDALAAMGPRARAVALDVLREATRDPWSTVRTAAALALGEIGGPGAFEALRELRAREKHLIVLAAATEAVLATIRASLRSGSEPVPDRVEILTAILVDPTSPRWRIDAAEILGEMGDEAVPAIGALRTALLEDPRAAVRRGAAFALATVGSGGVDILVEALGGADGKDRFDLIDAIAEAGPAARAAVPALLAALADWETARPAAYALQRIGGPEAAHALASFIGRPGSSNVSVQAAVPALMDVDADLAASTLADLLRRSEDLSLSMTTLWALGSLGAKARLAVPEVSDLLDSERLGMMAMVALGRIGGEEAVAIIARSIRDPSNAVTRRRAIRAAGQLAMDHADTLVPAIATALDAVDWFTRASAAGALGRIGAPAREVRPALERLLEDPVELVRESATGALERIPED